MVNRWMDGLTMIIDKYGNTAYNYLWYVIFTVIFCSH